MPYSIAAFERIWHPDYIPHYYCWWAKMKNIQDRPIL